MNSNHLNSETISVLHFRLSTARHKKRMQHKHQDKQLLAIQREQNALYQQQHNLGWIVLNPPVVRGWKRYFVLRDDVAKSKQAAFFEGILSKINTTQYSHRKDFKIKKRKLGRKVQIVKGQQLRQPDECFFHKLKYSEAEKQFFEERWVQDKWASKPYKVFVFAQHWRFVLRVRLNIITKTRARDEVIESRIQQIRNYIEKNALRGRLNHLKGGYSYSNYAAEKPKEKNPLKNKPLAAILQACYAKEHNT